MTVMCGSVRKRKKNTTQEILSWFLMAQPLMDSLTPGPVPELLPVLESFHYKKNVLLTAEEEAFKNIILVSNSPLLPHYKCKLQDSSWNVTPVTSSKSVYLQVSFIFLNLLPVLDLSDTLEILMIILTASL